jgi:hypothetical protein
VRLNLSALSSEIEIRIDGAPTANKGRGRGRAVGIFNCSVSFAGLSGAAIAVRGCGEKRDPEWRLFFFFFFFFHAETLGISILDFYTLHVSNVRSRFISTSR